MKSSSKRSKMTC